MEIIADLNIEPQSDEDNIFRNCVNYDFKSDFILSYLTYISQEQVDYLKRILEKLYSKSISDNDLIEIVKYLKYNLRVPEYLFKDYYIEDIITTILDNNKKGFPIVADYLDC